MISGILKKKKADLQSVCKSLSIKRLYVFGSAASNNLKEDSDIDILISFSDKLSIEEYTNNYFALHYKLRELFNRNIDIITERSLSNPYFIESINESKVLLYES